MSINRPIRHTTATLCYETQHGMAQPSSLGYIRMCYLSAAIYTPPYLSDEIQLIPEVIDSHPGDSRDVLLAKLGTTSHARKELLAVTRPLSLCLSVSNFT